MTKKRIQYKPRKGGRYETNQAKKRPVDPPKKQTKED